MIVVVAWLIAVPGVFVILWVVSALIYLWAREALLFRRLKARRRIMEWKAVQDHLEAGEGTLIIQQTNKVGMRLWWTPDDFISSNPEAIREFEDLGLSYITGKSSHPFVPWCAANYLSLKTGKAFLARSERLEPPLGPVKGGFIRGRFPKAKVVYTLI